MKINDTYTSQTEILYLCYNVTSSYKSAELINTPLSLPIHSANK